MVEKKPTLFERLVVLFQVGLGALTPSTYRVGIVLESGPGGRKLEEVWTGLLWNDEL